MSKETVQKIFEAEAEAERLVAEARERATAMRAEAEAAGKELCRIAEEEVTATLSGMLDQLRAKAEEHMERVMQEAQEEAEALEALATLNRKSAEKIVIGGVNSKCR